MRDQFNLKISEKIRRRIGQDKVGRGGREGGRWDERGFGWSQRSKITDHGIMKKLDNDQESIQANPTSHPQAYTKTEIFSQKTHTVNRMNSSFLNR